MIASRPMESRFSPGNFEFFGVRNCKRHVCCGAEKAGLVSGQIQERLHGQIG
jgi:hypothetical protein